MLAMILLQLAVGTNPPADPPARFFTSKPVDFWGTRQKATAPPMIWSEGERPAGAVADLIERPSAETARRYLDWQRDRLDRLQQAVKALEQVQREETPARPAQNEILYFTREGCPWCRRQDAVLSEMGLQVRRVTPDQADAWKINQVTATPTLVIPGRKPLQGFQTRRQIEEALR